MTVVACGFALLKGDTTERYGGTILLVAYIGWNIIYAGSGGHPNTNVLFATDLVELAAFAGLALHSKKLWAILAAFLQSVGIVAHLARNAGLHIDQAAYIGALDLAAFGIRFALIGGTLLAWRERAALRSFGIDAQPATNSPASARSIRSSVRPTPKIATKDPKRGPWF